MADGIYRCRIKRTQNAVSYTHLQALRASVKNTEYRRKPATSGKTGFSNMDMQGFVTEAERRRTARLSWMRIW